MGFLTRLLERRLEPTRSGLGALVGAGMPTFAGPQVTEESALRSTAVWACVRIISESLASLPLVLYRRQGRNRYRAEDRELFRVLHDQANPEMTAFEMREFLLASALRWGNGYAEIVWDDAGQIAELWPLRPDRTSVWRGQDNELWYLYQPVGDYRQKTQPTWLPRWKVHHLRGLSGDGVLGYSPIRVAALQAIGLSLATEEFGARYFSNGAQPRLILTHPGQLSPEALERIKKSWEAAGEGLQNAHRTRIIEEGMDVKTVGVPPEEAQFLETRKFQVTEIARIFRVPPHMLADLERATFGNIEHQSLEFVMHTLRPWIVRHEQAISRDLLVTDEEQRMFQPRYIVEGLLRGDTLARYQSYREAIQAGWLTRNEIREMEDRNPVRGGDALLMPLNMAEVNGSPLKAKDAGGADGTSRGHRRPTIRLNTRLFEEAAGRLARREAADIQRSAKRLLAKRASIGEFETWVVEFYRDLRGAIPGYFRELLLALGEDAGIDAEELHSFVETILTGHADDYTATRERQLQQVLDAANGDPTRATAMIVEFVNRLPERTMVGGLIFEAEAGLASGASDEDVE